jgi:SAM-dependent methyltransferase
MRVIPSGWEPSMDTNWGALRRTEPISREFGYERGTPIDRYYIERFLHSHAADITGRVVEIGDDTYTVQFGARGVVRDILHVNESNPKATIIADLAKPDAIRNEMFDCAIITQTLHLIFEPQVALKNLYRALKPGGILLATVPGITPLSIDEWSKTWYWSFTRHSVMRLVADVFGASAVEVEAYGNVFAATCFLEGVAVEEVTPAELDVRDPDFDVLISIRACRAGF